MRIVGIDEVGRGSLIAGVYSVAVLIETNSIYYKEILDYFGNNLKDSKKLNSFTRHRIFDLFKYKIQFSLGIANVYEIDKLNIFKATQLSMIRACNGLCIDFVDTILIDGNRIPDVKVPYKSIYSIVKGDEKELSIACASIFAKHIRDKYINLIHSCFPFYEWYDNKGYGTKKHLNAIARYGYTCFHRKTFNPVKNIIKLRSIF